jgi:hypothetical protein
MGTSNRYWFLTTTTKLNDKRQQTKTANRSSLCSLHILQQ